MLKLRRLYYHYYRSATNLKTFYVKDSECKKIIFNSVFLLWEFTFDFHFFANAIFSFDLSYLHLVLIKLTCFLFSLFSLHFLWMQFQTCSIFNIVYYYYSFLEQFSFSHLFCSVVFHTNMQWMEWNEIKSAIHHWNSIESIAIYNPANISKCYFDSL